MRICKWIVFSFLLLLINNVRAQDDSEENVVAEQYTKEQLKDERDFLDFQNYFLTAVQQRSVENYDRAIENLHLCKNIYPNNVAMLFELTKNYLSKNDFLQALHYANSALGIEPDHFWIKSIKRDILIKMNNLPEALVIQKELYQTDKSEAQNLLGIYYSMQDRENGKKLIEEAQKKVIFIENLNFYKKFFLQEIKSDSLLDEAEPNNTQFEKIVLKNEVENPIHQLKLLYNQKKYQELLSESTKNIELKPTQPLLYLYKGMALNQLKNNQEAIVNLENGLDFVFDDNELIKQFYNELIFAYQALGNISKVNYYKQLVQKLK